MKEISYVHSKESVYIRRGISFTFIYKNILTGQANYFAYYEICSESELHVFPFFFNFYQSR